MEPPSFLPLQQELPKQDKEKGRYESKVYQDGEIGNFLVHKSKHRKAKKISENASDRMTSWQYSHKKMSSLLRQNSSREEI
jgi:hypothetical protein